MINKFYNFFHYPLKLLIYYIMEYKMLKEAFECWFFKYLLIGDMLSNFHFSFLNVDFLWNFGNVHLIAPELLLQHSKDVEEYDSHLVCWPDIFSVLHGWIHFSKPLFGFDLDNLWNLTTAQPKCLFCCWMNFLTRCISKQN